MLLLLCAISLPEFTKHIQTSTTLQYTSGTTDDLVEAYNSGIKVLIEKHNCENQSKSLTTVAKKTAEYP